MPFEQLQSKKLLNTDDADDTDSHGFFIFCFIRVNPSNPCYPRSRKDGEIIILIFIILVFRIEEPQFV
jgi:hypothetical protein